LKNQATEWKSCHNLYFETDAKVIEKPLIGLISKEGALINNIFYLTSIGSNTSPNKELLSVTVIDYQNLSNENLIEQVKAELKMHCGIDSCKFIKQYDIPKALPNLKDIRYEMLASETRLTTTVFLAGDTQLNASLNAAMISGERAALGIIETLTSTISSESITSEYR